MLEAESQFRRGKLASAVHYSHSCMARARGMEEEKGTVLVPFLSIVYVGASHKLPSAVRGCLIYLSVPRGRRVTWDIGQC